MRKSRNYWIKERCIDESKKYNLRSEFKLKCGGAYNSAKKNGWLDEICSHMTIVGNKYSRLVYVYEFEDNSVYVGLTYNMDKRDKKHRIDKKSKVYRHINKTGFEPRLSCSEYMSVNDAVVLEGEKIEYYRNMGLNVLNEADAGAVGGGLKWTKEKCHQESLKYKKRTIFARESGSAYNSARNNGWLDEVCSHMDEVRKKPKGYWTKELCRIESLKYKSKKELYDKNPGAYMSMFNNDWLEELCPHMNTKKPNGYWTEDRCREEAEKFNTKSQFQKNNGSAYRSALSKGWLDKWFK